MPILAIIFAFTLTYSTQLFAMKAAEPASLEKLLNYYKGLGEFTSDFSQTKQLTSLGMVLKGKGQLQVLGAAGVIWKVTEPAPLEVAITSTAITVKTMVAGKEQITSYSLSEGVAGNQIAASVKPFLDLFTGSMKSLHQQFEVKPTAGGFSLTPKTQTIPIKSLELSPDAGNQFLARVVIREKSGDSIEYQFEKPTPRVPK